MLNTSLEKVNLKAHLILLDFEDDDHNFTLEEFEAKFGVTSNETLSIFEFWTEVINEMESFGKNGNAAINQQIANSIRKFLRHDKLSFGQVNLYFLLK